MTGKGRYQGKRDGSLQVTCWCEKGYVVCTPQELLDIGTKSCGRPGCAPPPARKDSDE